MIIVEEAFFSESLEKILLKGEKIALPEAVSKKISACYEFLKDFASDKIIYGINTGFGPMSQYRIDDHSLLQLQYNIIRSHATGAGRPLADVYVRAAMVARVGTFVQARSGVHAELVELLVELINRGIYPLVPEHGSVGASGDLVQLAHIALALIGEGEVRYCGEWRQTADVFKETGLKPLQIRLREGLSVTNGTSVMSGIGMVNVLYAKKLLDLAILASVWINEITQAYDDGFSDELNRTKKHAGQRATVHGKFIINRACLPPLYEKSFRPYIADGRERHAYDIIGTYGRIEKTELLPATRVSAVIISKLRIYYRCSVLAQLSGFRQVKRYRFHFTSLVCGNIVNQSSDNIANRCNN